MPLIFDQKISAKTLGRFGALFLFLTPTLLMTVTASFMRRPGWDLRSRLRAAGLHFIASIAVAALAAALVFGLWYPGAYRSLSGGRELFLLVVAVDVVLGPLLTFAVFDRAKGFSHLRRDLAVIVALQLAALAYGLYTVYIARPIALVFERDRFRVISAVEVYQPELPMAPESYRQLTLTGPWQLGLRDTKPGEERKDAIFKAVFEGVDTSQRPIFWVPYSQEKAHAAAAAAKPLAELIQRRAAQAQLLQDEARDIGLAIDDTRYLPVRARGDWVALMDKQGVVRGFAPVDGY